MPKITIFIGGIFTIPKQVVYGIVLSALLKFEIFPDASNLSPTNLSESGPLRAALSGIRTPPGSTWCGSTWVSANASSRAEGLNSDVRETQWRRIVETQNEESLHLGHLGLDDPQKRNWKTNSSIELLAGHVKTAMSCLWVTMLGHWTPWLWTWGRMGKFTRLPDTWIISKHKQSVAVLTRWISQTPALPPKINQRSLTLHRVNQFLQK